MLLKIVCQFVWLLHGTSELKGLLILHTIMTHTDFVKTKATVATVNLNHMSMYIK